MIWFVFLSRVIRWRPFRLLLLTTVAASVVAGVVYTAFIGTLLAKGPVHPHAHANSASRGVHAATSPAR